MALEVKRQNRETSQGLVRRFTKAMQQSGILIRTRRGRFMKRIKSEGMKKKAALRREEKRLEYEKKRKMGELEK